MNIKDLASSTPTILMHLVWRHELIPDDPQRICRLVEATGFFSQEEIDIAGELAHERLLHGQASGYHFSLAEADGHLLGYTCHGPIPGSLWSHDLYWIAVHPDCQGQGLGSQLLIQCEQQITEVGGARLYADTSSRPQYRPSRVFYEHSGFDRAAKLPDFYGPGDGKVIFCKILEKRTETTQKQQD